MKAIDVVDKYDITGEIVTGPDSATDERGWEHYAMTIRLRYMAGEYPVGALEIVVPWRMGTGLDVGEFTGTGDTLPRASVAQVIYALGQDLPIRTMTYPEYADEYAGWDESGYRTWELTRDLSRQVYDWCYSEEMAEDLAYAEEG